MSRAKHLLLTPYPLLLLLLPYVLFGQELPLRPTKLVMESGTPVNLQLTQTISSAHAKKSDRLEFVVDRDVEIGGFTVIKAGAKAEGSVVRIKRKRPLGIGGNVIIKIDAVELATGERAQLTACGIQREIPYPSHGCGNGNSGSNLFARCTRVPRNPRAGEHSLEEYGNNGVHEE